MIIGNTNAVLVPIPYLAGMVASPDEIKAMEAFFQSRTLDKEFRLNEGIKINDLPRYIRQILESIKSNQMADAAARPRWDDLLAIKKMLEDADKNG